MQKYDNIHTYFLQKMQEAKKKLNKKEFCKLHGISESKLSRFPTEKFIEELILLDYMMIDCGINNKLFEFDIRQ